MIFSRFLKKDLSDPQVVQEKLAEEIVQFDQIFDEISRERTEIDRELKMLDMYRGEFRDLDNRINSLKESENTLTTRFQKLDKQTAHADETAAILADVEKKIGNYNATVSTIEQQLADLSHKQNAAEKAAETITALLSESLEDNRAQLMNAVLEKLISTESQALKISETVNKSDARSSGIATKLDEMERILSSSRGTAESIQSRLALMDTDIEQYKMTKEQVRQLNTLAEHVVRKTKELKHQQALLEKTVDEQGQLYSMNLKIKSDLKYLEKRQGEIIAIEKNISRLADLLNASREAVEDVKEFRSYLEHSADQVETIRRLNKEFDANVVNITAKSEYVDEVNKRVKEVFTIARNTETTVNTIVKHRDLIEESHSKITGFEKNVDKLTSRLLETENDMKVLDTITDRLSALDARTTAFEEKSLIFTHAEQRADAIEQRLSWIEERELKIEEKEKSLLEMEERISNAVNSVNEFIAKEKLLEELTVKIASREQELSQLTSRFAELEELSETTRQRIEMVQHKMITINEVERKLTDLDNMVTGIDHRISDQLSRQSMIEKTEKRLDQLNYLLGDVNMKIQSLERERERISIVEQRLTTLGSRNIEAERLIEQMLEERRSVQEDQERLREIQSQLKTVSKEAEAGLLSFQKRVGDFNTNVIDTDQRFNRLLAEHHEQFKRIESEKSSITDAESRVAHVRVVLNELHREMEQISLRSGKIDVMDHRIEEVDTVVSSVELRMEKLEKGGGLIDEANRRIDSLNELVVHTNNYINSIQDRAELIDHIRQRVTETETILTSVDHRMDDLARKEKVISEAEKKITHLELMAEDISAQINNLREDEKTIAAAIEKGSELRFLLGEVESKLDQLRIEKEKLS